VREATAQDSANRERRRHGALTRRTLFSLTLDRDPVSKVSQVFQVALFAEFSPIIHNMPANKKAARTRSTAAPRPSAMDEPRDTPEWIGRLRQRIQAEVPAKREWAEKAVNLILELMDLSESALSDAAKAPDNWHAMFRAMRNAEVLEQIQKSDPLARAFLDGLHAKARLIEENGGVFKTDQVAEYLGVTPQAVNKRRALRQLVGITFRKRGYVFPAWQFTDRGTVAGLEQVLLALANYDEWMQNVFFINPNTRLGGRRPLDLLREGEIQEVLDAAREFGQHGAA